MTCAFCKRSIHMDYFIGKNPIQAHFEISPSCAFLNAPQRSSNKPIKVFNSYLTHFFQQLK